MKKYFFIIALPLLVFLLTNCSSDDNNPAIPPPPIPPIAEINSSNISYLALGDSYTIGQSVCETCRFPEQLKVALSSTFPKTSVALKIIATTGWTTTNLLNAIEKENLENNFDLVTLLIGVNNQYQGREFSLYETEFPQLLNKAVTLAKGDKNNVIVVSIPDYAYTPSGQATGNQVKISEEINKYNAFASVQCANKGVKFVDITDITRNGLKEPDLVASDGLHPSKRAYDQFVSRILPKAISSLTD